jgi:hypothetical protein
MFRRYFENGLSVIPVQFKDKKPAISKWSKYCDALPTEAEIESWEKGQFNIGLACGKASGIIAIDIDKDSALSLCPPSPVRRKGKKGEVRFFRYSDKIQSLKKHDLGIEIFSTGSQVLLPPSIHPEGMPYQWITPDTLETVKPEELPILDLEFITRLKSIQIKDPESPGRNNKLVSMITAAHKKGKDKETIAAEVYEYDRDHHSPSLFTDPTEQYKAKTESQAKAAALKMVQSVTRTLGESKASKTTISISEIDLVKPTGFQFKPYPKPRGLLLDFYKACELRSAGKQDALALGGAISLMSILASNRFATECRGLKTCPNTYVINLGYSGFGKDTPQTILNEILSDTDLIGSGNYKSGTSIIMDLPKKQERLDLIDECSTILSAMGSKESYASQMVELLSELFSKGPSRYVGQTSVANGDRFGAAFNPHISILGSTTPKGFRTSINKEVAAKGLLPRMLLFFQHEVGEYKGRQDTSALPSVMESLKATVDLFLSKPKEIDPNWESKILIDCSKEKDPTYTPYPEGKKYQHQIIPFDSEAMDLWFQFEEDCHKKKSADPESFESAFIARFAELSAKLALLDALATGKEQIDADSFLWAKEVIEIQWHNAAPLFMEAHAESNLESEIFKILNFIRGRGMITKSDLKRKFQRVDERIYNQAINSLIETGQVQAMEVTQSGPGRPKVYYQISPGHSE